VTDRAMDVVLGEAADAAGNVRFTNAFSKPIGWK
jgi:cytolysin (calcineurin-like family phosphatase)